MEVVMKWKIGIVAALLVVATSVQARAQAGPSLQGVWRVTEVVVTGANAKTETSPQPGLYLFTKKHYSLTTVNSTAPRKNFGAAQDPNKLTEAEKIARYEAWNEFSANAGTYEVSGNTITAHPVVAKNPAVMGPAVTREFRIEGNTLTLIRKSAAGQPASVTTTKLTRVE
jgi:hypothetical protein